ncbi:MAG TPA: 50S ribosomal protein L11 methyltransferase [Steroidobacteraceae bacterium]
MSSWGHKNNIAPRVALYPQGAAVPPLEPGWIALALLPVVAGHPVVFGDGSHPSTRLCASAVDLLCRQRQPEAVLDVGTGTGLLARIARARGASVVVGTDIDPVALASAKAHSSLDAYKGEIHFGPEAPDHWGARFDLIVANILEAPLRSLAPALGRALKRDGTLLLSGFTRLQIPALQTVYERAGLSCLGHADLDEWTLLTFVRPAAA